MKKPKKLSANGVVLWLGIACAVIVLVTNSFWLQQNQTLLVPNPLQQYPSLPTGGHPFHFPRIIWTYWNEDEHIPTIVKLCVWRWQFLNPGWEFRFLTPETAPNYVRDFRAYQKAADSPARLADFVRLYVVDQYGGVWADASIMPLESLDNWLVAYQDTAAGNRAKTTTVFQLRGWNHMGRRFPLIESWFFAAWPRAPLISAWRQQFDRLLTESPRYFIKDNEDHGTKFQGMDIPEYLAIHVAAQRAIQDNPSLMDHVNIHDAEDGPYRFLWGEFNWDSHRFCREYLLPGMKLPAKTMNTISSQSVMLSNPDQMEIARRIFQSFSFDRRDLLIKIRGGERGACEEQIKELAERAEK